MLRDILLGVSRQKRSLLLTITKTCANWWHFSSPPGGYEVLEAQSGRAAIHAAMEGNPNLILLDLRLPDMNGIEVARELQKIPETAHIPVIAWTADYHAKPHRDNRTIQEDSLITTRKC